MITIKPKIILNVTMVSGESRVQISGKGDRPEASGLPQCNNPVYWSADLIGTPLTYLL